MGSDVVFYQFSRLMVEDGDFSHFLGLYGTEKLPNGQDLRLMMNSIIFGIEGYDDDPREVHSIPEIRQFYAAFHEAWPYWLYFCNFDTDVFRMMVLCCLPSITAMKVDGRPTVAVEYNPLELVQFLSKDFVPMNTMCEQGRCLSSRFTTGQNRCSSISSCHSMRNRHLERRIPNGYFAV